MAIVRVAGERPRTDDQPLLLRNRETDLDTELVGLSGFALADAFDFRGV